MNSLHEVLFFLGKMKVSNVGLNSTNNGKHFVPPPIPLSRPETPELKKNEYLVMKLRSDPADPSSQTYDLTIKYYRTGTPEEWLLFQRDLLRILVGQNITTGPAKYAMTRRLIVGDTLAVFNQAATKRGAETVENFKLCLRDVTTHVFPQRALSRQKRYMRRHMRKTREFTTREFAARLAELNAYLAEFPPFEDDQGLAQDEIVDILNFGVPNTWQKNMVIQGFDPTLHTPSEFVEFCERHEFTEGDAGDHGAKPKTSSKSGNNGATSRAKTSEEAQPNRKRKYNSEEKYCAYHQCAGHSTDECKVVLAQIERMRGAWEASRGNPQARHDSHARKKNWSSGSGRNSTTAPEKKINRESVMSIVKESMKKILSSAKSRKTESCFNLEDLEDFEPKDFEALSISDDDSSEGSTSN